ncbi:bacteriorhodopsin [Natrarchaeobaculum aegyptiacum]|uniref:Sensory rhodopsin-2 n=1 Tax=Natrarchaeobaculum aegyptiacum TaxID=745377 RepID=A0A2Z2HVG1_9EURY|nr:bacteriorhodopsin [Natrarchaeobaculum aegyptiacum]ARS90165.1 sensory rhodopsin-2 [Natrarchaeobaculum aegyptiacum]
MIEPTALFWVGAFGMAAGTVAFVWGGIAASAAYRRYYAVLTSISLIAAVAYALMALEIGWIPVGEDTVFVPRYIDWILTTPLLLYFLALLAGSDRRQVGLVVGINTVVMVLGFAAALLEGAIGYGLFAVAALAYLGLLYLLLGPMTEEAADQGHGVRAVFTSLRNLTVVLWSIYPIVWLLGPPGIGIVSLTVDVMLITYLDLLTKVGFGLIALNASAVLEAELGRTLAGTADGSGAGE